MGRFSKRRPEAECLMEAEQKRSCTALPGTACPATFKVSVYPRSSSLFLHSKLSRNSYICQSYDLITLQKGKSVYLLVMILHFSI